MPTISVNTNDLKATGRILRKPSHTFQVRHRPFQIQPVLLAPVLPGETMKNALIQIRVVTDPVKSSQSGWWYEFYMFYVKHRDMPDSSHFQRMVLELGYDVSPAFGAANQLHYHAGGAIDWADQCLRAVVPRFFRADGEAFDTAMLGGLPSARINAESWLDSVMPDSEVITGGTVGAGTTMEVLDKLQQQFELMRDLKMTTMTYEEFLSTYGVRSKLAEPDNQPELLRYLRDWNYPARDVDTETGASANTLAWSIAERGDKDRYFSEPGFIFGCVVARPKVYLSKQTSTASTLLGDAMTWLPAILHSRPETSLKKVDKDEGPLAGTPAEDYWVDVRDIFSHGDQFTNLPPATADAGMVALPTPALQKRYPSAADADGLFVNPGTQNLIRADGIVSLQILGTQRDHT